jgi:PAS domain S-box-containing protein
LKKHITQISRVILVSVAAVAVSVGLRLSLFHSLLGHDVPFIVFYPAIFIAAWYGGFAAGLLTTALSGLAADYLFMPPLFQLSVYTPDNQAKLAIFIVLGAVTSLIMAYFQRTSAILKESEARYRTSEERFRLASMAVGSIIYDLDVKTDTVVRNQVAEQITGYSLEEMGPSSKWWKEQIHSDDLRHAQAAFDEALSSGRDYYDVEYRFLRKDGKYIWLWDKGGIIRNEKGEVVRLVGSRSDITTRKETEAALRRSEQLYRAIGEAIDYGVWMCDAEGRNIYASESFLKLVGITQEECSNLGWKDVLHPDDAEETLAAWLECAKSGGVWSREHRFKGVDGKWHPILARGVPIRDEGGVILGWAGINLDISEQKRAEVRLHEALRQAEIASQAKTDFLANMSHEIRTPMNAIVGLSNILGKSKTLSEREKEFVSTLQSSAQALLTLLNDVLDLSKLESSKIEIEHIPFEPAVLLMECRDVMAVEASKKGLAFHLSTGSLTNLVLLGDPMRIRQIVLNLLSNAFKFTSEGEVALRGDYIDLGEGRSELRISVHDTGIGMKPEILKQIFEKFTQADASTTRLYGGTGLGLAICKSLAEMMSGKITVTSEPGHGSDFTLKVPLQKSGQKHIAVEQVLAPVRSGEFSPEEVGQVLLVDDYEPNILVARTILEEVGLKCGSALDGREALLKLEQDAYGLLLIDVQMPGLDGYEVTRRIRQREKETQAPRLPIIAITAYALEGDR